MEQSTPIPTHSPSMPQSGWWKCPQSLATDPVFLRVDDERRLASVGLYVGCVGWTLTHNSAAGWVPEAAVANGQVVAGPREQLVAAAEALVNAGLLAKAQVNGMDGYIVAGAAQAVTERYKRQASAAEAGRVSQERQADQRRGGFRKPAGKPNPDAYVDWSNVSEEL